jgi:hypothetical protein
MRNVSNERCKENQNTHFMFSNFCPEIRGVYKKNIEKYGGSRKVADGKMGARCMLDY